MPRPPLRKLIDDGLEELGTFQLDGRVVAGDPTALAGSTAWSSPVHRGTWRALGHPWARDPDQLDEVVLVHDDAIASFYDLYDAAVHAATLTLPTGRLAVVDASKRLDTELLRSIASAEAFPWVLDLGVALGALDGLPAQIAAPKAAEVRMILVGLGPAPDPRIATSPSLVEDGRE